MLPESMAPPLANYDQFKTFMADRGIRAHREYVPEWEDPETKEVYEGHWTVVIGKEKPLPDGKIYMQFIDLGERMVLTDWPEAWSMEADLLEMALKRGVEEHLNAQTKEEK
jgi:hypothetical protein